jgi:hypothetical protein
MAQGGKLNAEQKLYAVQRLACFDSPSAIAKDFRKDLGIDITPQSIENYDPTKSAGKGLGDKFRTIFEETRKAFLEDTASVGISHRAVRLRTLQRMADMAENKGNMVLVASLLEQAAKEMGNAFTNRREVSGPDGGPIKTMAELSDDDLAAIATSRRT